MQATFKVNLKLYWNKKSCDFEILDDSPEDAMEDDDDDEAEDSESQNEEAQEGKPTFHSINLDIL